MARKEIVGVRIKLATPERIREISSGEVKKPETINYRTLRPEKDGLFCERIFGPTRSYECACGKYKRSGPKFRGVICDRCGVEVTDNRVRRERMGHIELAVPVVHIWYLRGIPSRLSLLLGTSAKDLEKVVYFAPTRKNESAWKVTAAGSRPDLVRKDAVISESEKRIFEHYDPAFRAEEAFSLEYVDDISLKQGDLLSEQQTGHFRAMYGEDSFKAEEAFSLKEAVEGLDMKAGTVVPESEVNGYINQTEGRATFQRAKTGNAEAFVVTAVASLPFKKGDVLSKGELGFFQERCNREGEPEKFRAVQLGKVVDDPCHLVIEPGRSPFEQGEVIYEREQNLCRAFDEKFEAGIGADGVQTLLNRLDLDLLSASLREEIAECSGQKKRKLVKRLQVVEDFRKGASSPQSMILTVLPVIPPELRPLVPLDGGRFATSDLNDLYRRVINRNNRLKKLQELKAPEIIIRNEKRMLQECVDALIDNGRVNKVVLGAGNRPLKSLTDLLRGKKGRFRQNLLGKRVDYSGRSVIVIGPTLKIYQCGLPKQMALELFKPFVIRRLVDSGLAPNVKNAKRVIERGKEEIWGILEEIIKDHPVMLNRAPTLHRLGIQAFEPVLMEGKAIRLHPMVCTAFNADFDGDQMAIHVPLSIEAQAEARLLMLSANNLLSPASGRPVVTPTQDIVLGVYYLTDMRERMKGEGMHFDSVEDVLSAFDHDVVHVNSRIWLRERPEHNRPRGRRQYRGPDGEPVVADRREEADIPEGAAVFFETSPGRAIFNNIIAPELRYVNDQLDKKRIGSLLDRAYDKIDRERVVEMLDSIKSLGYHWAARSGISFGVKFISTPPEKEEITRATQAVDNEAKENYELGLLTYDEYLDQKSKLWGDATKAIAEKVSERMEPGNSVHMMVASGARGSLGQMGQMAGIRGLMADPTGKTIDYPITANFHEGMNMLEYFISTHGARKGLADTALRTAKSGYLTRRLVDVAQDLIITEHDCGTDKGICIQPLKSDDKIMIPLGERVAGRTALRDVTNPETGEILVPAGEIITGDLASKIDKLGIEEVWVRSPLACALKHGICQKCYGSDLSSRHLIPIGEAVGVVAAQSIGEPGTQLTMRTFHTGGVRSAEDITQGLPRIEQLFEVRRPRKVAILAGVDGVVEDVPSPDGKRKVLVKVDSKKTEGDDVIDDLVEDVEMPDPRKNIVEIAIPASQELRDTIAKGTRVTRETKLTEGSIDPQQLLEVSGIDTVQRMLVDEIQYVYHSQGVSINNKHIEVILRKVAPLNRVKVIEEGDTAFVAGDLVWLHDVEAAEKEIQADNVRYVEEAVRIFGGDTLRAIQKPSEELNYLLGKPLDEEAIRTLLTPGRMLTSLTLEHGDKDVEVIIGEAAFQRTLRGMEMVGKFGTGQDRIRGGTILSKEDIRRITAGEPSVVRVRDRKLLSHLTGSRWLAEPVVSAGQVQVPEETRLTEAVAGELIKRNVLKVSLWRNVEPVNIAGMFRNALMNSEDVWMRDLLSAAGRDGAPVEDLPRVVDADIIQRLAQGDITAIETPSGLLSRAKLLHRFLDEKVKGKVLLDLVAEIPEESGDGEETLLGREIDSTVLEEIERRGPVELFVRAPGAKKDEYTLIHDMTFMRKLRESPECRPFIHGITKAALATDSFLSAASFQQTAQILAGAAVRGQVDPLHGLKENVIIGHLIPAGTGAEPFRAVSATGDSEDSEMEKKLETERKEKRETRDRKPKVPVPDLFETA
ncbi:MAG: DNA-directed RNA polymerase subunit beta' [Synergistaceae bacterium]|nr:DNA-directed RNA polymerase subunit beta' [Synergistaceae bacterium]